MTRLVYDMTERQLQSTVLELCKRLGLLSYHTHDSRRSEAGFPDLMIVGRRLIVRELKTNTGHATRDQLRWLACLQSAGVDAGIWRPADLHSGAIARQLQDLRLALDVSGA